MRSPRSNWNGALLAGLEPVIESCLEASRPITALSALMDSMRAHAAGDRLLAERSRDRIIELAEKPGLGSMRMTDIFARADLAMRQRRDALARDICDDGLARDPPRLLEAGLLALRGSPSPSWANTKRRHRIGSGQSVSMRSWAPRKTRFRYRVMPALQGLI